MTRFFIESLMCGLGEGGMACGPVSGPVVAEAKIRMDDGQAFYMSLAEVDGIPNFFKTENSTYEMQVSEDMDEDQIDALQDCFIETGDYEEIFEDQDSDWYQLYRLLIYAVRADWDDCERFQKEVEAKYLDEIDIPASDIEEEYLDEFEVEDDFELPETEDDLFRMRLAVETDVATESVFHDMDAGAFQLEEKHLQMLISACESEEKYQSWKDAYIKNKMSEVGNQKFLTCTYLFAGIGQYETVIPEAGLESFKCWINRNGSAFFGGTREATVEEIKTFIALQAAK